MNFNSALLLFCSLSLLLSLAASNAELLDRVDESGELLNNEFNLFHDLPTATTPTTGTSTPTSTPAPATPVAPKDALLHNTVITPSQPTSVASYRPIFYRSGLRSPAKVLKSGATGITMSATIVHNHQATDLALSNGDLGDSKLQYTVSQKPNVINLDDYQAVVSIYCYTHGLDIYVNGGVGTAIDKSWTPFSPDGLTPGTILVGSREWGCRDLSGKPVSFRRKIISKSWNNVYSVVLQVQTLPAAFLECFDSSNIAFSHAPAPGATSMLEFNSAANVDNEHVLHKVKVESDSMSTAEAESEIAAEWLVAASSEEQADEFSTPVKRKKSAKKSAAANRRYSGGGTPLAKVGLLPNGITIRNLAPSHLPLASAPGDVIATSKSAIKAVPAQLQSKVHTIAAKGANAQPAAPAKPAVNGRSLIQRKFSKSSNKLNRLENLVESQIEQTRVNLDKLLTLEHSEHALSSGAWRSTVESCERLSEQVIAIQQGQLGTVDPVAGVSIIVPAISDSSVYKMVEPLQFQIAKNSLDPTLTMKISVISRNAKTSNDLSYTNQQLQAGVVLDLTQLNDIPLSPPHQFQISFDCGFLKTGCHAYVSGSFTIASPFGVTVTGDAFPIGGNIPIKWDPTYLGGSMITLTLVETYGGHDDNPLWAYQSVPSASGALQFTVPSNTQIKIRFLASYYIRMDYNYGGSAYQAQSNSFGIQWNFDGGWNYDTKTGQPLNSFTLWKFSTQNTPASFMQLQAMQGPIHTMPKFPPVAPVNTNPSIPTKPVTPSAPSTTTPSIPTAPATPTSPVNTFSASGDLTCDACYVKYHVSINQFQLIHQLQNVQRFVFEAEGTVVANLDLLLHLALKYQYQQTVPIGVVRLLDATMSIGDVSLETEATLTISVPISVIIQAAIQLQWGATATFSWTATVKRGTDFGADVFDISVVTNQVDVHKPLLTGKAVVDMSVGVKADFAFAFGDFLSLAASTTFYLATKLNLQLTPQFPAYTTGYPPITTDAANAKAPLMYIGQDICKQPHDLDLSIQAGIKDIALAATVDLTVLSVSLLKKSFQQTFGDLVIPLLSGCMLGTDFVKATDNLDNSPLITIDLPTSNNLAIQIQQQKAANQATY